MPELKKAKTPKEWSLESRGIAVEKAYLHGELKGCITEDTAEELEMFLIFNLGRLDVLPVHDLGVQRGFQITYGKRKMPKPEQLERFGGKWRLY